MKTRDYYGYDDVDEPVGISGDLRAALILLGIGVAYGVALTLALAWVWRWLS